MKNNIQVSAIADSANAEPAPQGRVALPFVQQAVKQSAQVIHWYFFQHRLQYLAGSRRNDLKIEKELFSIWN